MPINDIQQQINGLLNSTQKDDHEDDAQLVLEDEFLKNEDIDSHPENNQVDNKKTEDVSGDSLEIENKNESAVAQPVKKNDLDEQIVLTSSQSAEADKQAELPEFVNSRPTVVPKIEIVESSPAISADVFKDFVYNIKQDQKISVASDDRKEELQDKIKKIELERKEAETQAEASIIGTGYINLVGLPIVPEALRLIDEKQSRDLGIICFMYRPGKEARFAIRAYNEAVKQIISSIKIKHDSLIIKIYLTSEASLAAALKLYAMLPKIIEQIDDVTILEKDINSSLAVGTIHDLGSQLKHASTTEILSLIISTAIKAEASDIHIEAEESQIQVRFRIDGVLHTVADLERGVYEKLISRIKLNSKLKINIKDKPQDGSFSVHLSGKEIDFRVSSLPTTYGESIVMRVLYHDKVKGFTLDKLGIEDYYLKLLQKELTRPNGMLIVTGPTGSGKTTTLYAILNKLNTEDNKIITIEDPIEYKIEGINQSEVKVERDYTFAKGLRSIVRQDPDIVLVGEIRDTETAEIALNAALTGHLVFSTLHTNDAIGAIPRFLSLGAKPYLLAPALNIVIAQRLVRRLCSSCKREETLNQETKERVANEFFSWPEAYRHLLPETNVENLKFYYSTGCAECNGIGYHGQIAIFEMFIITDEIKEIILSQEMSEFKLKEISHRNGMVTMAQDGILKALKGMTSLTEVFRVT